MDVVDPKALWSLRTTSTIIARGRTVRGTYVALQVVRGPRKSTLRNLTKIRTAGTWKSLILCMKPQSRYIYTFWKDEKMPD